MTFDKSTFALVLGLVLASTCVVSRADWTQSVDMAAVKPMPDFGQMQPQNPPSFSWSRHVSRPASYTIEIKTGDKVVATYTSKRNFLLPTKALAEGTYTWRVTPTGTELWSTPRSFVIGATSKIFEVPESDVLRSNVLRHGRSTQLPKDFLPVSKWTPQMQADRGPALTRLSNDVLLKVTTIPNLLDSEWITMLSSVSSAAKSAADTAIRNGVGAGTRQFESAALLFRLTNDPRFLAEALRRGDQLAALDPNGPTSYANQDQATRQISLSLAKGVDMMWNYIDLTRRNRWLASVNTRTAVIYADLSGSDGRLDQFPYDSHGGNTLGYLAMIATLCQGDIPAAQAWFDFSVRAYINAVFAWSGAEGGFSQGTAYATYTADAAMQIWQPLSEAIGFNVYSKPWADGFAKYFMYFLPPGTPGHVFGDQREVQPDFALTKAFASRFGSPAAAWYVKNQVGDEYALTLLQAKYPLPVQAAATTLAAPPDAALFPSIGWVAMHSSLADRGRTSLYFKSSPYGSYNHSHSDQNTFVLNSGGRRLMIESGYEDYYMSPLVVDWYRQTKSHNGITYDGGIGQFTKGNVENLAYNGKIVAFSTTATLDYAEGDATAAYGGNLSQASRKVWYLRGQYAVVLLDKLSSPIAHQFEWNMHGAAPIVSSGAGLASITNIDRSVCITQLNPSDSTFLKRIGAPPKPGVFEDHAAFVKNVAATSAEFLVVLDVGCKRPAIALVNTATGRSLSIGSRVITLPK